jgi:hypothetical protein
MDRDARRPRSTFFALLEAVRFGGRGQRGRRRRRRSNQYFYAGLSLRRIGQGGMVI